MGFTDKLKSLKSNHRFQGAAFMFLIIAIIVLVVIVLLAADGKLKNCGKDFKDAWAGDTPPPDENTGDTAAE